MDQRHTTRGHRRPNTTSRRGLRAALGAAAALAVFVHLSGQPAPVTVERDGDRLRLRAPQLNFVAGAPLARLHDGRSVTYVLTASIRDPPGRRARARPHARGDLQLRPLGGALLGGAARRPEGGRVAPDHGGRRSVVRRPPRAAARAAPADKAFVVKLECSLREENAPAADALSATTFTGLIDFFSRKEPSAPPRWEASSPPLRVADLIDRARK